MVGAFVRKAALSSTFLKMESYRFQAKYACCAQGSWTDRQGEIKAAEVIFGG
jgi:hypothetical protein